MIISIKLIKRKKEKETFYQLPKYKDILLDDTYLRISSILYEQEQIEQEEQEEKEQQQQLVAEQIDQIDPKTLLLDNLVQIFHNQNNNDILLKRWYNEALDIKRIHNISFQQDKILKWSYHNEKEQILKNFSLTKDDDNSYILQSDFYIDQPKVLQDLHQYKSFNNFLEQYLAY